MKLTSLFAVTLAAVITLGLVAAGCGGSAGGSVGGHVGTGGTGTVAMHMSDAPISGVTAVNITIPKVEANIGGQWQQIAAPNQTYNLLNLAVTDVLLGQASVPAGSYTQVRLYVSAATVTDSTGTHNVTVPSGAQSGIKLNVDFTVSANQVTDILVDFNVAQSLHQTGNGTYMLKPVIPCVVEILSGTITGVASNGTATLSGATISAKYTAGSSYALGTIVNTSTSLTDGTFKVWALLPGTYELDLSYTNPTTSVVTTAVVTGVTVTANQNSSVGTVVLQ